MKDHVKETALSPSCYKTTNTSLLIITIFFSLLLHSRYTILVDNCCRKYLKVHLYFFSCLHIITCQAFQYVSLVKLSSLLLVKTTISANTHKKAVTDSNKGKMSIKILCSKMIQNTGKLFHQRNYYMERITS
jgi:hypothetical protein